MKNLLLTPAQISIFVLIMGAFAIACGIAWWLKRKKPPRVTEQKDTEIFIRDKDKEREKLFKKAEAGDAEAQFKLAQTYEFNESGKYMFWLEKAAEQEYEEAIRTLADEYNYGNKSAEPPIRKNRKKAAEYLKRLADKGDIKAMKDLSLLYAVEFDDDAKSCEWTEKAAEAGDVKSMEDTAFDYRVRKDFDKAEYWFKRAIDAGSVDAIRYIGDIYCYFEGRQDFYKAESWYRKALAAGDDFSNVRLGDMYRDGKGFDKDEAKAFELYKKAADKGDASAKVKVAECYRNGIGTPKDENKAFEILSKAAKKSIMGKYALALCYFDGTGTERDYKKAVELFKECPEYYHEAMNKLGECYYFGYGVTADREKAREYWQKAVKFESEQAAENLKTYFNETTENQGNSDD